MAAHIWLDLKRIACFVLPVLHGNTFHRSLCFLNACPCACRTSRQVSATLSKSQQFTFQCSLFSCPLKLDPIQSHCFITWWPWEKTSLALWCFTMFPWTVKVCAQAQADFCSTWGTEQLAQWSTSKAVWLAQMWFANRDGVSGSWLTPWLCYRLPLGFCPWHTDTSTVSERQVLWAFSGTFCLTKSYRIRCWQMEKVPASPSWPTSMFIPSQQSQSGTGFISLYTTAQAAPKPTACPGLGKYNILDCHHAYPAHSLHRKKPLPYSQLAVHTIWPCKFSPMELECAHSGLKSFYTWSKLPLTS